MIKANKFLVLFNRRIYRRFISSQSIPVITSPVPTQENIAHLILDQKSAVEALQTFRWASNLPNFTHSQSTYRALIHKLCLFRRFEIVYQLLDEMRSSTCLPPDEGIFITIARGLGRARRIREVIKVLDLVSRFDLKPSLKLMNSILDVLVKEDIDIAREFYRKKMMECGVEGNDYTYGILMKGLCATNRIGDGFKLLQVLKTRGMKPNIVIYNTLIHALCENGKVGRARSLMREIAEPSDVTFNILISAYCKEDNSVQAMVMLEKSFSKGFIPDVITVTKVVGTLCKKGHLPEAVEVLERVEERGGEIDVVAYNTLINGYCRLGKVKAGQRLLKEMEMKGYLPNAETYNALISGLCECGMLDMALDMFNEMQKAGIKWDFATFDTVIHGLSSVGRVQDGFKILALMEDSKEGCRGHISPYNGIIYGLYRENRLEEAFEFLKKMESLFPRAVDRSLRILSFCKDGSMEEAKNIYAQMIGEGGIPSAVVYAALIHTFCQKEQIREALELMNEMVSHGYSPVASTLNALIRGLCRQGKIQNASRLLEDMVGRGGDCFPDIESYSPFIEGFCSKGDFHKAFIIFLQMVERGIVPNSSSWNTLILCLCQENGWLEDQNLLRLGNQLQSIIET
ncbi:pentatricopeptide repeat-containing protein At2g17525, mitochondrial [Ipomoea triloba]|uniref:pentatricopeptide repeat-containing protein At2g17525, mitochondrial n=1 Tax=Ipomoea triloba TaxID=35885 RepID=UPI00125D0B17|nr:pentatricopeptide repeat-containing protein At2g17525, mitochondrial [Ipomoea triloba]